MAFGCFCDIYQQDGKPVRMHYEGTDINIVKAVTWIGIQEETAEQFRRNINEPTDGSTNG